MFEKLFGLVLAGTLLGGVLAATVPMSHLTAQADSCWCTDDASGDKKCNLDQDACIAGDEICQLCCGPPEVCEPEPD